MARLLEMFLKMKNSVLFLFAIACNDVRSLRSSHLRSNISRIFTGIFLHLFLPLSVLGNSTGLRSQSNYWCQKLLDKQFVLNYECYSFLKENTLKNRTSLLNLTIQTLFLSQTVSGILGNFSLLCHYFSLFHIHCRLRDKELILIHLTLANFFLLVSKSIPKTIAALGWKNFSNDLGCHFILYVNRVSRAVSIGTTCLLSVYQTIMISPINSWWKDLKVRVPKSISYFTSLCWILNMLVNLMLPIYVLYVSGQLNNRHSMMGTYLKDCSVDHEKILGVLFATLVVLPQTLFSVLIFLTSGYMIFILFRHKQQVQSIHRTHLSPRSSAVSRATQSILLLLITFLCFHTLSSMFAVSLALQQNPETWLVNITEVISLGFPTVSPFLLLRQDSTLCRAFSMRVCRTFSTKIRTRKSSVLMRIM